MKKTLLSIITLALCACTYAADKAIPDLPNHGTLSGDDMLEISQPHVTSPHSRRISFDDFSTWLQTDLGPVFDAAGAAAAAQTAAISAAATDATSKANAAQSAATSAAATDATSKANAAQSAATSAAATDATSKANAAQSAAISAAATDATSKANAAQSAATSAATAAAATDATSKANAAQSAAISAAATDATSKANAAQSAAISAAATDATSKANAAQSAAISAAATDATSKANAAAAASVPASWVDTDDTLAANSDSKLATQKAVKAYVTAHAGGGGGAAQLPTWTYTTGSLIPGTFNTDSASSSTTSTITFQAQDTAGQDTVAVLGTIPVNAGLVMTSSTGSPVYGTITQVTSSAGAWIQFNVTIYSSQPWTGFYTVAVLPGPITAAQVGLGSVTNDAQLKASDLDTDTTMAADSDTKVPSQKATRAYVADYVTANTAMPWEYLTTSTSAVSGHRYVLDGSSLILSAPGGLVAGATIEAFNIHSSPASIGGTVTLLTGQHAIFYCTGGGWYAVPENVTHDSGWTANSSAGDKTVAVPDYSPVNFQAISPDGAQFDGTTWAALDALSAQVQKLTQKLQAIETALASRNLPNN